MKTPARKSASKTRLARSPAAAVKTVFAAYPAPVKAKLLALRRLILDTAKATKGVGALVVSVFAFPSQRGAGSGGTFAFFFALAAWVNSR